MNELGFATHDVLTILGLCITFGGALATMNWRITTWVRAEIDAADQEAKRVDQRVTDEVSRMKDDIAEVRLEFSTALAKLPTRAEIDGMLAQRIAPLEHGQQAMNNDVRSLTLELARAGIRVPPETK